MSVVINTNSDALRIQGTLSNATDKLSQTMQRMSSGLKINSAKDDAAGTVISARMNVQLNGNKICQQNVQNANSLLSTTEGNLDVVLDNVSRIRDLTLQAKNTTYSTAEKEAMQSEVAERIAEINRISESAKFSQLKLFDGDLKNGVTFQVGQNETENDTIAIDGSKGLFKSVNFYDLLTKSGTDAGEGATYYAEGVEKVEIKTADEIAALDQDALKAASEANTVYYDSTNSKFVKITTTEDGDGSATYVTKDSTYTEPEAESATNKIILADGVTNSTEMKEAGVKDNCTEDAYKLGQLFKYVDVTGENPVEKVFMVTKSEADSEHDGKFKFTFTDITDNIATENYAGKDASDEVAVYKEGTFDLSKFTAGDVNEDGSFAQAIAALDKAIDNITARKSAIGSAQGRLSSALDTLTTQYTNLTSAKSIITDADVASEAASYTQNQILQQISTSLLAQANQAPSIAMSLL